MDITGKKRTFESAFPLMTIVGDVLISKKGDLTIGWELEYPSAYNLSEADYDELESSFINAVAMLPPYMIVHKQDFFVKEKNKERRTGDFLRDSYFATFASKEYPRHRAYIYLTLSSKGNCMRKAEQTALISALGKGKFPAQEDIASFFTLSTEFISILTGGGKVTARRLGEKDYDPSGAEVGLLQRYLMLGDESPMMTMPEFTHDAVYLGDKKMVAFSISEAEDMPDEVGTVQRVDTLSSGGSDVFLSAGSAVGVNLDCNHIVNHYVMTLPQQKALETLSNKSKRMQSGISNAANRTASEDIESFIDDMHRYGRTVVNSHFNVLAWSKPEETEDLRGMLSTALKSMKTKAVCNTFDTPIIYFAGIPGAASELGAQNFMMMELSSAVCFSCFETFDREISGGNIYLSDRMTGRPLSLDITQVAQEAGLITNLGCLVVGPSGSGKSFTLNKILSDKYLSGEYIFIIDVGDSYEFQCQLINEISGGRDGIYLTWDNENPLSFNPFLGYNNWLDESGHLMQDNNGLNCFISFLQTLYQPSTGWDSSKNAILNAIITEFLLYNKEQGEKRPIFDDFYKFVSKDILKRITKKPGSRSKKGGFKCGDITVTPDLFDIENFILSMDSYSSKGSYYYLLNDRNPKNLSSSRFTVCEVNKLSKSKDKKFYSICILFIMNTFDYMMESIHAGKTMVIEEAWAAIASETMAPYLKGLWKTGRKYSTAPMVVTQQITDLMSSEIIKDTIVQNSAVRIILDQSQSQNNFEEIQSVMGFSDVDKSLILSLNKARKAGDKSQEVFISWGTVKRGVYKVSVSLEQALIFESKKEKKQALLNLAKEMGSIELATKKLADIIRTGRV